MYTHFIASQSRYTLYCSIFFNNYAYMLSSALCTVLRQYLIKSGRSREFNDVPVQLFDDKTNSFSINFPGSFYNRNCK